MNFLFEHLADAQRYLEIGVQFGQTFESISAESRVGVEPQPQFNTARLPSGVEVFSVPSDEYFASLDRAQLFDVVFVDGLHEFEQTYRDVIHSFQHLAPRGVVLIDDVVPCDHVSAIRDPDESLRVLKELGMTGTSWHGDVFLTLSVLRQHHPELVFRVVMGSGNPQAVVWNTGQGAPQLIDESQLAEFAAMTYDDVFDDGEPPEWMCPGPEEEILNEAIAAVSAA